MMRQQAEITARIVEGPKEGKTKINFSIIEANGNEIDFCDDVEYKKGESAIVYYTNDAMYSGIDVLEKPCTINVYDSSWNLIGTYHDTV